MVELQQLESNPASNPNADAPTASLPHGLAPLAQEVAQPVDSIDVTPKAVDKIREIFAKNNVQGGLRLGVLGGGCSGLSYQFKFDAKERSRDHVLTFDDVRIFVDPKSMIYLKGMILDYKESLMQSGFAFENPNAKKACGCGTSFTA
ncbi:MAG: iron-sulfur cluster assembly accessory protein [Bryobacterales bacterium]|nr:iron-sulfur cluster assembly accessory protein [Bryobacterales bacterium]